MLNIEYWRNIFTRSTYKFSAGNPSFSQERYSFARDLYQLNLSDKTRKTYNQINIISTHCQVNKIKNVTVCSIVKENKKEMIKLNDNGEKGFLTGKIDIKSLIINLQSLLCLGMWVLGWRKYVNINQVLQGD